MNHITLAVTSETFIHLSKRIIDSGATIYKENTSPGNSLYFLDPDGHPLEIHVGNWQTRIAAKKIALSNWQEVEWFV